MTNNAEVSARANDAVVPLQAAAFLGQKDVAELLLASGADVNARDNGGDTPLRVAEDRDIPSILVCLFFGTQT
jgi:ankyrin repeat protein